MNTVFGTLVVLALASTPNGSTPAPEGRMVEHVRCAAEPSQTYTLYLPRRHTNSEKWPALLVLDAAGRSTTTAELFREAADRWGWVLLSSDDTRSEGGQTNIDAVNALWCEAHSRWSIDPRRLYAAGFSGTGHVAYLLGKQTGELAGVIVSGSRPIDALLKGTDFALFGAAGHLDFNYRPMLAVDRFMAEQGNPHRFEVFEGHHQWMPPELAAEAVAWMELVAMRRGLRTRNQRVVDTLYQADVATAEDLERSGELLAALRRFRTIVGTFEGLRDTVAASTAVRRLDTDPAVAERRKEDRRQACWETSMNRRFEDVLGRLAERPTAMPATRLRRELKVAGLQKKARLTTTEGVTARRLLATLHTHLAFYLTRRFVAENRWRHLESALTVAAEIDGAQPIVWYNLACARARLGCPDGALEALRRAVALGFDHVEHIRSDPDLDSLRERPELATILREVSP